MKLPNDERKLTWLEFKQFLWQHKKKFLSSIILNYSLIGLGALGVFTWNGLNEWENKITPVKTVKSDLLADGDGRDEYSSRFVQLDGETYRIDISLTEYAFEKAKTQIRLTGNYNVFDSLNFSLLENILTGVIKPTKNKEKTAQKIFDFVCSFPYLIDPIRRGDYIKSPLETIVEGGGDCEDLTLLCAGLFQIANFDYVLIEFNPKPGARAKNGELRLGHMAVGIAGDFSGTSLKLEGKNYYICETTGTMNSFYPNFKQIGDFDNSFFDDYNISFLRVLDKS